MGKTIGIHRGRAADVGVEALGLIIFKLKTEHSFCRDDGGGFDVVIERPDVPTVIDAAVESPEHKSDVRVIGQGGKNAGLNGVGTHGAGSQLGVG